MRGFLISISLIVVFLACAAAAEKAPPRPVVAIVALNRGTETTDFLVPYGILSLSAAAEVHPVSTEAGPIELHPALNIELDETIASFDAAHPDGADFVIVPAVADSSDARLVAWLASQAQRGATLVAICDGVWAVAETGVLDGRRATGHWYSLDGLAKKFPKTEWVRDRRYVRDGNVMTTTGVTASLPASLALVETIDGRPRAEAIARQVGMPAWNDAHDSARYALSSRNVATLATNWLAFWNWETIGVAVAPGDDEIALALTADALARTYRSKVMAVSADSQPVRLKHGLRLLPGTAEAVDRVERVQLPPASALDHALAAIERSDGTATADFVALQLEYPRH